MKNKGYFVNSEPINISDDSDEENIPLKNILAKQNGYTEDQNSYDSLCTHKREACEFCDRISKNRYSSLIHNVSHIIIPLLNQTVFQCPTCLHSFTSKRDLRLHTLKKHPEEAEDLEPLVNHSNSKQRRLHTSNGITQPPEPDNSTTRITNPTKNNSTAAPIKSRLQFEEDDLIFLNGAKDKQLLIDLTTDCKVKLENFETPWLNGEVVTDEFYGKSVHYDDLMKPGVYRCKKCGKRFPVRFDAIVHESTHVKFKNSQVSLCVICKQYLIGGRNDLRHHYLTFHKGNMVKSLDEEYKSKLIFVEDEEKTFDSKLIFLCNLCLSFCKNTSSIIYDCVTTKCEIGKRYECQKCCQLFFDVNVVKRSLQRRALYGSHSQKKRKKTNAERLKTIAKRFKKMKH